MLVIRAEQMEAFQLAADKKFQDEMVEHLGEFAPKHCEVIGEPAVREVVRTGISRARSYGFTTRGPVRLYLEMKFMFGSDFDTDPQLPWAAKVLEDTKADQAARAEGLFEKVMDFREKVFGPDYKYEIEALRRGSKAQLQVWGKSEAKDGIPGALKSLYPEKVAYCGDTIGRELSDRAATMADEFTATAGGGRTLLAVLMLIFGHGVADDPQFAWVGATLRDEKLNTPKKRVEKLFSKTAAYLRQGLANMEEK